MKKCKNCGQFTLSGYICSYCGAQLDEEGNSNADSAGVRVSFEGTVPAEVRTGSYAAAESSVKSRLKGQLYSQKSVPADSAKDVSHKSKYTFFKISPRIRQEVRYDSIEINAPPIMIDKPEIDWVATLVPAIITISVAIIMAFMMKSAKMLIYTMPLTIAGVLLSYRNHKLCVEKFEKETANARENYSKYIKDCISYIEDAQKDQRITLKSLFPSTMECFNIAMNKQTRLWQRGWMDSDFLTVCIGNGTVESSLEIKLSGGNNSYKGIASPKDIQSKYCNIQSAPISFDLREAGICGVIGEKSSVTTLIKNLIVQVCTHICYTELKIVVLHNNADRAALKWIERLPHVQNDNKDKLLVAYNRDVLEAIYNDEISGVLKSRIEGNQETDLPCYLFVILDQDLLNPKISPLKSMLFERQIPGVLSIMAASKRSDLPKECKNFIFLNGGYGRVIRNGSTSSQIDFTIDNTAVDYSSFGSSLEFLISDDKAKVYEFPEVVTLFDVFGVKEIDELDFNARWDNHNSAKTLASRIGIASNGEPFSLDFHEGDASYGPHALVVGMTGSGKSQFIVTYVLSMAMTYSPNEVAFLLIDYKEGSMSSAFDDPSRGIHLPHLAGTISNLDDATIHKAITAIDREKVRRQSKFIEVANLSTKSSVDILEYQTLYRKGLVSEPMPQLIIIVDEFAKMKDEHPQFIEKIVTLSQQGRSAGMHLFFTTQTLSGVVDNKILDNITSKICMMVNTEEQSNAVIQSPNAKGLPKGRFYFKAKSVFELAQAAYCSAPYTPSGISRLKGTALKSNNTGNKVPVNTQFLAVMYKLQEVAEKNNITVRPIWLPMLPVPLDAESIKSASCADSPHCVELGLIDDIEQQAQYPLTIDLAKAHNVLIYGDPLTGKTTLLMTMLFSLCKKTNAEQLNFYVLDYSSRLFEKTLAETPQCGAVINEEDVGKLTLFFDLLKNLLQERKKLFSRLEVDDYESAAKIQQIPLVLVVIDNFSGLTAIKDKQVAAWCDNLHNILRDSSKFGVQFIVTASQISDVSLKLRQCFSNRISFHMMDPYAFAQAIGYSGRIEHIPPNIHGRVAVVENDRILEAQIGIYRPYDEGNDRTQWIKLQAKQISKMLGNTPKARRLPNHSVTAEYIEFADQFPLGQIPLGISQKPTKFVYIPFKHFSRISLYFGNPKGVVPVFNNFLYIINRERMKLWIVKASKNSIFDKPEESGIDKELIKEAIFVEPAADKIKELCRVLSDELATRQSMLRDYCNNNGIAKDTKDIKKYTYTFMRTNTIPTMILFEDCAEFCLAADTYSALIFDRIFDGAGKLNMYFLGAFYPRYAEEITKNSLCGIFNSEYNYILYGGQFDKQNLCPVPPSDEFRKILPYNTCLIYNDKKLHAMVMPCGEIENDEDDEDDNWSMF